MFVDIARFAPLTMFSKIPISLSVRIWPFQGRGRGSIPRWGISNFCPHRPHQPFPLPIAPCPQSSTIFFSLSHSLFPFRFPFFLSLFPFAFPFPFHFYLYFYFLLSFFVFLLPLFLGPSPFIFLFPFHLLTFSSPPSHAFDSETFLFLSPRLFCLENSSSCIVSHA